MRPAILGIVAMMVLSVVLVACSAGEVAAPDPIIREVEKIVTVEVPVEREVIKQVEVIKEVIKEVEVERLVEVERIVTVEVETEVEVVMEKIVTVEVEREVEIERVLVATPTPPSTGTPRFGGTLRIVSQASIASLDPIWTSAYVTIAVSTHMYEGLFGLDSNLASAPRMVSGWSLSSDAKTYTMTLREGLNFHDGRPVTVEHVIPSLDRWLAGQFSGHPTLMRQFTAENPFRAVNDLTFTVNLNEPYGAVLAAFAMPWQFPVVMPAELAANAPTEAVEDWTGSGPYKFNKWDVGHQIVLDRNTAYIPRNEPANHMVGGTQGYIDQLVFLEVPDEETKLAGLETGEWDLVDGSGLDFFDRLDSNPDLVVPLYKPGHRSNIILNTTIRPFGHSIDEAPEGERHDAQAISARQSVRVGVDIEKVMLSLGPSNLWVLCSAIYYCGTPLDQTSVGPEYYNLNDKAEAARLLGESTYAGETLVLLNPTDYATITPTGIVIKQEMEEIGFVIDMPALDWSSVVTRFRSPETWQIAASWTVHWCCGDPISDEAAAGNDPFTAVIPEVQRLRKAWATAQDAATKRAIQEELETILYEQVIIVHLGQFFSLYPHTAELKNPSIQGVPYYANAWLERR